MQAQGLVNPTVVTTGDEVWVWPPNYQQAVSRQIASYDVHTDTYVVVSFQGHRSSVKGDRLIDNKFGNRPEYI